jgi:hypothetical protein
VLAGGFAWLLMLINPSHWPVDLEKKETKEKEGTRNNFR